MRFYVDADVLGLAHVIAPLRSDITYPGDPGATVHRRARPPCIITSPAALDTTWVPVVAEQGCQSLVEADVDVVDLSIVELNTNTPVEAGLVLGRLPVVLPLAVAQPERGT